MAEMLYEVTDFFVTIESKLAELEEAREWQEQEF